ncbi:hypothetical protein RHMOL_Rhmol09G0119100 [Rhododendron molle]|uniref:Uncharacterized protein n=1 Tax=Rhododendron molle TaxID=49168 RepID=A0ACC0ME36_RHOML|nr:hypothetical protein RHMOL_Rhmol09G0119100 [Rhododendron molle]
MDRTQIVCDKWTYATTQIFIEVMLEEAKKEESTNSKKTRTFNPHQWVAICSEFGRRTNAMGYSVQKLREKFSRLKHELSVFKDLKDHSGFGWDPVKQTVTAPEPVWQEYLQGHKDAKQFKSKGLDHYDLLVELCEGTLATGAFAGYPSTLGSPHSRGAMEKLDSSDVVWNFLQKQISKVLTWSSVLPVCWYYLCCCVQPLLSVDCAVVWPITLLLQQLLLHAVKQQFCGCCFLMPPFEAAAL